MPNNTIRGKVTLLPKLRTFQADQTARRKSMSQESKEIENYYLQAKQTYGYRMN